MIPRLLLMLLASLWCVATAAPNRALHFRDIIELKEPSQPRISPDGAQVAFVLSYASVEANSTRRSLWIASDKAPARVLLDEAVLGPVEWASDSASDFGSDRPPTQERLKHIRGPRLKPVRVPNTSQLRILRMEGKLASILF